MRGENKDEREDKGRMKKIIALMMALVMVLGMAGCGESKPAPDFDTLLQGVFQSDSSDSEYTALLFDRGNVELSAISSSGITTSGIGHYEIDLSAMTINCLFSSFRSGTDFSRDVVGLAFKLTFDGSTLSLELDSDEFFQTSEEFRRFRWVLLERITPTNTYVYKYDSNGRIIDDGEKQYTYNDNNTLATYTYLGNTTTLVYDANGVLVMGRDEDGAYTTYEYDALGRIDKTTYTVPSGEIIKSGTEEFEYDANGYVKKRTVTLVWSSGSTSESYTEYVNDSMGNVLVETMDNGRTWVYEYDEEGLPISCTHDGTKKDEYKYGWIELVGEDYSAINRTL